MAIDCSCIHLTITYSRYTIAILDLKKAFSYLLHGFHDIPWKNSCQHSGSQHTFLRCTNQMSACPETAAVFLGVVDIVHTPVSTASVLVFIIMEDKVRLPNLTTWCLLDRKSRIQLQRELLDPVL